VQEEERTPQTPSVQEVHSRKDTTTHNVQEAEGYHRHPVCKKKERTQKTPSVHEVKRTPHKRSVQDRKNTTEAVGKKKKDSHGRYCDLMEQTPQKSSVQEAE
jgi:hypothetical protein